VPLPLQLDRGPLSAQLHRHADYTNPLGHLEKTRDLSGFRAVGGRGSAMAGQPGFIDGEKHLTVPLE
jgi:hypothetical protein